MSRPKTIIPDHPISPYPIIEHSHIICGFGRGSSELGIPTANVHVSSQLNVLEPGIYYGWCKLIPKTGIDDEITKRNDGTEIVVNHGKFLEENDLVSLPMVMSIGWNPFYQNERKAAEVHIIHKFKEAFYGANISYSILGYVRPELNYTTKDFLSPCPVCIGKVAKSQLKYKPLKRDNIFEAIKGMLTKDENDICNFVNIDKADYCSHLKEACDHRFYFLATKYYCSPSYSSRLSTIGYTFIITSLLSILLLTLSILVANYFFKNLRSLTKIININNQILSFIFVPLANATPDMANYYITMYSGSCELMLGQVIGSTLITLSLIISFIIIMKPFSMGNYKIIILDFYLLLVIFIMLIIILSDGKITLIECIFMTMCYLIYLVYLNNYSKVDAIESDDEFAVEIEETVSILSNEDLRPLSTPAKFVSNVNVSINDISVKDYAIFIAKYTSSTIFNIIDYLISFSIPVSSYENRAEDYDKIDIENENRYDPKKVEFYVYNLKVIWFFIEIPLLINSQFVHTKEIYVLVNSFLLYGVSRKVKFTEKFSTCIINITGILSSLIIIFRVSYYILILLKNFGLILLISDYSLGLLIFSIGNSINDMVTNVTIAIKIDPILGLNACLGTPILLILIGIGLNGTLIILLKKKQLEFKFDEHLLVSTVGLVVIVVFLLCSIPLNNWKFDRKIGIVLIILYISIFSFNCFL